MSTDSQRVTYIDEPRADILRMIPQDGHVIGSIGCSRGATEEILVRQGKIVHGVDIDPRAIEVARGRLTSARLVKPDETELFPPHSLDGLILADVLEHVPMAWLWLKDVATSVRPGGWVAISVPNMRSPRVLMKLFVFGDWEEAPMGLFDATHVQVMTRKRLVRWCRGAQLVPEKWFDHPGAFRWERRINRVCDFLTARIFHEMFTFEHQVLCRKR
ncbi:MAG: class I SAM-dependent methyltransferase [Tepidisphaerales bacterium]